MAAPRQIAPILALAFALAGCGDDAAEADAGKNAERSDGAKASPDRAVVDKLARGLEELAGARVKAVWVQQQKPGQLDQHAGGTSLKLMAFDSAERVGERALIDDVGSYSRPLITPDGGRVVFSDKGVKKSKAGIRRYRPRCFAIGFDGSGLTELGEGYAECLWRDPADGALWVYAGVGFKDADSVVMEGARLERFRIDAPGEREIVWDKSPVGADAFGLSRDGSRMAGLFPWPDAGVAELASGNLVRTGSGCWTAMAPDDSGVMWVFDGAHRNATFYTAGGGEIATVALGTRPELKGHRIYHPRWSNHPRFAVVTGPYLSDKKKGADKVEAYLLKLAPGLDAVEASVPITSNGRADLYPDVWIEGGAEQSLGEIKAASAAVEAVAAGDWPPQSGGLVFAWKSTRENVEVAGEICRVRAEGAARYGRRFEMAPGEGRFVVEALAGETFPAEELLAFEAVITPAAADGPIIRIGDHLLAQVAGELQFSKPSAEGEVMASFGKLEAGKPVHVWVRSDGGALAAAVNGEAAELRGAQRAATRDQAAPGVEFGPGWDGRIERVAIYRGAAPDAAALNASAAGADLARAPVAGRVKFRGKLVEKTQLPDLQRLGSYRRALLYYLYEVEQVVEGELDAPRAVVAHWAMLDRKPAAGLPEPLGASVLLEVEPWSAHPQLKSEWQDAVVSDIDAPLYFDLTTPRLLNDEEEQNEQ